MPAMYPCHSNSLYLQDFLPLFPWCLSQCHQIKRDFLVIEHSSHPLPSFPQPSSCVHSLPAPMLALMPCDLWFTLFSRDPFVPRFMLRPYPDFVGASLPGVFFLFTSWHHPTSVSSLSGILQNKTQVPRHHLCICHCIHII